MSGEDPIDLFFKNFRDYFSNSDLIGHLYDEHIDMIDNLEKGRVIKALIVFFEKAIVVATKKDASYSKELLEYSLVAWIIVKLFEDINNYEDKDEVKQIKDRDYNNSMITKVENYIKNNMTMKNIGEDSEKEEIVVLSLTKLKHFIADANSDSDSD